MQQAANTPPGLDKPHKAGYSQGFPGGRGQVNYLAPLPMPAGEPPHDYAHALGDGDGDGDGDGVVNDIYPSFGTGLPPVFGWQLRLSGPVFVGILIPSILFPIFTALLTSLLCGTLSDTLKMSVGCLGRALK